MVIKRSPGGQACRWRAINFEIHLWSSGKNADCIFGDRSASSMSKWRPAWTLTPEMIHFRTKSVTLSMLIDLRIIVHVDRRRWRAHQLTYDLKRCLLFRKCLRFFESESSFGANVCHRRPGGSMATSHLDYSFWWHEETLYSQNIPVYRHYVIKIPVYRHYVITF